MPALFYQPIDRRQFIGEASRALVALALARGGASFAEDDTVQEKAVRLALLADTHIPADPKNEYRKFFPWENLKSVVSQVQEVHPEGVILIGDAARLTGEVEDYQALKGLLAPLAGQTPVFIGLGNHDNRDKFAKVFDYDAMVLQKVAGKHVLVIEWASMRFILLDSLLYVNQTAGLLGKSQRAWLSQYLEKSDGRSSVLFVHHTLGDGDGELLDVDRLFQLIRPHKKVKAIFYGHSHEYGVAEWEGVHLINVPAVGYNFSDSEPVGWLDARFTSDGVQFVLKTAAGNRSNDGKLTSLRWV
jgi:3',5'-cyclic AMP phosphodiesterase CpdA